MRQAIADAERGILAAQVTLFCSVGLAGTEVHLLAGQAGQEMD
jgi:hypothetical protein